mgnify:FL=1
MGRVYYNKLIRDNVPEKIRSNGEECEVREITDDQEFQQELLKKIAEEASALSKVRSREDFLKEYADLAAVIDTALAELSITQEEVTVAREKNNVRKGAFTKRYFLEWSSDGNYTSNESVQGIKG